MNIAIMTAIDNELGCTSEQDPEVKQRWYSTGLFLNYTNVTQPAFDWISSMGRNKYIIPIYTSLMDAGRSVEANQWNMDNIDFYCPITENAIQKILNPPTTEEQKKQAKVPRHWRARP